MRTKVALIALFFSQVFLAAQEVPLRLLPAPKQVTRGAGEFHARRVVSITVPPKLKNDTSAAVEDLAADVAAASGGKTALRRLPAGAAIVVSLMRERDLPTLSGDDMKRFQEEGYELKVTARSIRISAPTAAGLFYGLQTLRQLVHADGPGVRIPVVTITDWPSMRWRGVHDDISRGPIPTLAYMKKQVRTLAEYKINLFSLYMEHVFAFQSVPLAAPLEAAITPADIKELVAYAARYHVTLLPEQQAFGHLHHVLKVEKYADLAETPHGHVLAPVQEGSYKMISSMYSELAPLFPGQLFHIGADETWELGTGQTAALAKEEGIGKVYLDHIKRVSEILAPYHKRLMFWGDIAVKYPELLTILPKDAIAVAWAYDPRPSFDKELEPFSRVGLDLFVSPGANNWNRLAPDYGAAFVNIRNFIRDGQRFHALGALNTTWDDDGEALFEMTWPALIYGAAASWQSGESSIDDFKASYDWAFYRNEQGTPFADAVTALAQCHETLRTAKLGGANDGLYWVDPFSQAGARAGGRIAPVVHDLRLTAESAIVAIEGNRKQARLHADTLDALVFGAQRIDALGAKFQFADETIRAYRDAYEHQDDRARVRHDFGIITSINARLEDLRDQSSRMKDLYTARWMAENKPYWLGSVLVRFDLQTQGFQNKINEVRTARDQMQATKSLPAPETLGFFLYEPPPVTPPQN